MRARRSVCRVCPLPNEWHERCGHSRLGLGVRVRGHQPGARHDDAGLGSKATSVRACAAVKPAGRCLDSSFRPWLLGALLFVGACGSTAFNTFDAGGLDAGRTGTETRRPSDGGGADAGRAPDAGSRPDAGEGDLDGGGSSQSTEDGGTRSDEGQAQTREPWTRGPWTRVRPATQG